MRNCRNLHVHIFFFVHSIRTVIQFNHTIFIHKRYIAFNEGIVISETTLDNKVEKRHFALYTKFALY